MKIQVNTDRNIDGSDELVSMVTDLVQTALRRHEERLTRVEVHLRESGGPASTQECLLEARPAGMDPLVVTGVGDTSESACHDATEKMLRVLETTFGRIDDRDRAATIRQAENP